MSHLKRLYEHIETSFERLVLAAKKGETGEKYAAVAKAFSKFDSLAAAAGRQERNAIGAIQRVRDALQRYAAAVGYSEPGELPDCIELQGAQEELALWVQPADTDRP